MSADKDRGIRREKQKRAKDSKKSARAEPGSGAVPAKKSLAKPAKATA